MAELSYSDLLAQILGAMRAAGCGPHDPKVVTFGPPKSGPVHRYRVEGDKAGSANGWFIFYDDGIPAGAFGNWKSGITESWCSKREHELSDTDRAQRDRHLADAKAARAQQETQVRSAARQRAADLWAKAVETVDAKYPYLLKKQIPAIGIRQLGQQLVIPILDGNGALHSLQFIGEDGRKTFLTGGAIVGNCCSIGDFAEPETILVCEGYATGISLHCASGLPVIVAFNAGNLKPVAASLRLRYPHAALVICADDDRWTDGNPGKRKAEEAAAAVDGFAIFPLFDGIETDSKPTDFNDLHVLAGLPQLKAQLSNALANCQAPHRRREAFEAEIDATDDFETLTAALPRRILDSGLPKATISYLLKRIAKKCKVPVADLQEQVKQVTTPAGWKAKLRYDDNGALRPTLANIAVILNHHPDWRGVLFFDQFSGDAIKRRPPPVPNATTGEWTDLDSRKTRVWLEDNFDMEVANDLVDDAVSVVADAHSVHVVREHLDALRWDDKRRLKTAAIRYLGAEDSAVHRFVFQSWMIGAVKRVREPGVKFDNVLVLEGSQSIGKSTALDVLGGIWHAESITDAGSKDSLVTLRGKWIVEFSELDALGRVEVSRVKQHVSAKQDVYRQPFGRRSVTVPRQNVFAASCNPDKYLRDETGGRRFWPIRCGAIDIDALRRDRDQLWAEASALCAAGEQYWATPDMRFLTAAQEERFQEDPWEEPIMEFCYGRPQVLVSEVLERLRVDLPRQTQHDKNRVSKVLWRLGYRCKPAKRFGRTYRVYFLENSPCV
jgi:predicted P-loop ATPase/phage/plasmid primase-like uncharacterized protein